MHDPCTVAFDIRWPKFLSHSEYGDQLLTIWHRDPEADGSDDSCGWFTPPFSQEVKDLCKSLAAAESREPWFAALDAKNNADPILCERLIFGAFMLMSKCLMNRGVIRRPVSVTQAQRWAAEATHNSVDNFRFSLCFKSGYHSNWYKDGVPNTTEQDLHWREDHARAFFSAIAGWILRDRRPWYKHPRWHVWHWRFQFHPWQKLKRRWWDKCSVCGKRGFQPGTSAMGSWDGDEIWHEACDKNHPARVPQS